MVKLPKDMQKQKKRAQSLRTRGSNSLKRANQHIPKGINRQMRRRMQQQGVEGMEEIAATRVIIEKPDGENLVIEEPQVIKVDQPGIEAYQVIGNATIMSADEIELSESPSQLASLDKDYENDFLDEEPIQVEITEQDIQIVAMQSGVSPEIAEKELRNSNGDLAKAIMNLKSK